MAFTPVKLVRGDDERVARTAEEETNLRFNGWRSAPSGKKASASSKPADKTPANQPAEK